MLNSWKFRNPCLVDDVGEQDEEEANQQDRQLILELAQVAVDMAVALLNGESPDVNNTTDYDNGVKVVPSYLLESAIVVKDNITEVLVDSGYWTEDEING